MRAQILLVFLGCVIACDGGATSDDSGSRDSGRHDIGRSDTGSADSGSMDGGSGCDMHLSKKVSAIIGGADALAALGKQVVSDVITACSNIVVGFGQVPPDKGAMTDQAYVSIVCDAAVTAMNAAGVTIAIAEQPPLCTVDAIARFACETSCNVDATCDVGSVELRLRPPTN